MQRPWIRVAGIALAALAALVLAHYTRAIPNSFTGGIRPGDSYVPHEHSIGVASDGFGNFGTVTMGRGAAVADPDTPPAGNHQHRDAHAWHGSIHRWRAGSEKKFARLWDNRAQHGRSYATRGSAELDSGHGYIDEDGYGFRPGGTRLRYRFGDGRAVGETGAQCENSTDDEDNAPETAGTIELDLFVNDGCPIVGSVPESGAQCDNTIDDDPGDDGIGNSHVNDGCPIQGMAAPPLEAQQVIGQAFDKWAELGKDRFAPWFDVGIGFEEVSPSARPGRYEIQVLWLNMWRINGRTRGTQPVRLHFDCKPGDDDLEDCDLTLSDWALGSVQDAQQNDQLHLMTTALHEIGHGLGFAHTGQGAPGNLGYSGLMRPFHVPGCPDKVCYDEIDDNTKHGALDLYSIPTPDFGDAPLTYPTSLSNKGARASTLAYEWLGMTRTTRESAPRFADSNDSSCDLFANSGGGNVFWEASVSDHDNLRYIFRRLFVAAWVDWNQDGDWTEPDVDPDELLFVTMTDPNTWDADSNGFSNPVAGIPPGTPAGITWMRCRMVFGRMLEAGIPGTDRYLGSFRGDEGLIPRLFSDDNGGEIEDCEVLLVDTNGDEMADLAQGNCGGGSFALGGIEDQDLDGIADEEDNCPQAPNIDQLNFDGDIDGDACDADDDDDGIVDSLDDFPFDGTQWLLGDADGDGLLDVEEAGHGTGVGDVDSDDDGLSDGTEIALGTLPLVVDSDGDGIEDGVEVEDHTSPLETDSDGDGMPDSLDSAPMLPGFCGNNAIDGGEVCDPPGEALTCGDDLSRTCNVDCTACLEAPPGRVPDGSGALETPLRVTRTGAVKIRLDWDPSCNPTDNGYAVYEGPIGNFLAHVPVSCDVEATSLELEPLPISTFYLVVPSSDAREGSYGTDGNGFERAQSAEACHQQVIGNCGR